jgi:type I restriction enzyme, S subunit
MRYRIEELIQGGVLIINDGYRAKNSELGHRGLPFARAGNLNNGFQFHDADRFPLENVAELALKTSKPGDVVFTSKGTVGRFGFVKAETEPFVYSPQLCFWRTLNNRKIESRWLYYWMHGREANEQFSSLKGQTDMADYINLRDQRRMSICLPSIDEQRMVVRILGVLDDKIELNRRMNETLESMARAIFKSWFVDFDPVRAKVEGRQPAGMDPETAALFPTNTQNTAAGNIPVGWRVGTLRDCCTRVENGGTPRRDNPEFWNPPSIEWLTSGEVRQAIVTDAHACISAAGLRCSSAKLWPVLTTVVALYGATAGQVSLLGKEMCANQACCGLIPRKDFGFFVYLHASSQIESLKRQARGSAQQNLSQQIVAEAPAILPENSVAMRFQIAVEPLFRLWTNQLRQSRVLAELRDTLLPKLLSGSIRIRDAEKPVEAAV